MHHIHRVRPHHQGHGAGASHVDAFVAFHLADARQVSARSGVPVSVILAQSGLESGWGLHVTDNAYFGVRGHAPNDASVRFTTHEVGNGVAHRISDSFRSYRSYADAANDYADMLRRRFPAAFAHADDSLQFISYENKRLPDKEGDVQDVFFKSMTAQPNGTLLIENERGGRFVVDPPVRASTSVVPEGVR